MHRYTDNQKEFILNYHKGISNKKLTELFNNKFKTTLKPSQMKSYKSNHKLKSEVNAKFKKGNIPHNKGKKGDGVTGYSETRFKKGHVSHNKRVVGSERKDKDGYIVIKIKEPNIWKFKHKVLWEKYNNRKISNDQVVIFADSNKYNFDKDNLICISRKELLFLNKRNLIKKDNKITKTSVLLAKFNSKLNFKLNK